MKTVIYKGTANFQEFGKADFAKADIDQGKLVFEKDVPKEVSDEVFEVLTSTKPDDSPIFHDFPFEAGEDTKDDSSGGVDETSTAQKKAAKTSAKSQSDAVTDSGTTQAVDGGATPTAGAPVGNGSSTTGTTA